MDMADGRRNNSTIALEDALALPVPTAPRGARNINYTFVASAMLASIFYPEPHMPEPAEFMPTVYAGWHNYQRLLVEALQPLTAEQLGLRPAPGLRTVRDIAAHIVGARARWFHSVLGESAHFASFTNFDRAGQPAHSAADLAAALETTWTDMQAAIARWTPADWAKTYPNEHPDPGEPVPFTQPWVIWHLIEHDLHHGGEISIILGTHGLKAPAL